MHVHLVLYPTIKESVVRRYLKTYVGLGPVAYVGHQKSEVINLLIHSGMDKVNVVLGIVKIVEMLKIDEFFPGDTWLVTDVGRVFCSYFPRVCGDIVGSIVSADKNLDNYDRYDVLAGHAPG